MVKLRRLSQLKVLEKETAIASSTRCVNPPKITAQRISPSQMAANILGIGNAATPLGLRAMRDLQKLNPRPGTATNAMCTFLATDR